MKEMGKPKLRKTGKLVTILAVVAILLLGAIIAITVFQHSNDAQAKLVASSVVYFTIIESDTGPMEGMNGSAFHVTQAWPVIHVQINQTVIIHIESVHSSETHGFTITNYFDPGVALLPGGTYTVKFVANKAGTFLITCLVFCALHPLMDHGELVVSP